MPHLSATLEVLDFGTRTWLVEEKYGAANWATALLRNSR